MSKQKKEIEEFIWSESQRKEEEFSKYKEWIQYSFRISKNAPPTIVPRTNLKAGRPVYSFNSFHEYLTFLINNNPNLVLDTIESINQFPDSLRLNAQEDNAIRQIFNLFKENNWGHGIQESKLKCFIHNIIERDSMLEIEISPFGYELPTSDFYISVKSTSDTFRTTPFHYTGDLKKLSCTVINPVTHEAQVFRNK